MLPEPASQKERPSRQDRLVATERRVFAIGLGPTPDFERIPIARAAVGSET
jgi:hypothetical protein